LVFHLLLPSGIKPEYVINNFVTASIPDWFSDKEKHIWLRSKLLLVKIEIARKEGKPSGFALFNMVALFFYAE
jgi:hypothetical protein